MAVNNSALMDYTISSSYRNGIKFRPNGMVIIDLKFDNLSMTFTVGYEIKLIGGKLHLIIISEKDDRTSIGSVRIENDSELSLTTLGIRGYLGGFNKGYYIFQKDDNLFILNANDGTKTPLIDSGLSYMFGKGAVVTPQNNIQKSEWNDTSNGSLTDGTTLKWIVPGSSFMYQDGYSKPGNDGLTFVKYPTPYTQTPTLVFNSQINRADFTQYGGSHSNKYGWAYDSNGGSPSKFDLDWYSYGNF
jgi:hypothetical protein